MKGKVKVTSINPASDRMGAAEISMFIWGINLDRKAIQISEANKARQMGRTNHRIEVKN